MMPSVLRRLFLLLADLDRRLLAMPRTVRAAVIAFTLAVMVAWSLPNVPRQYVNLAGLPLIGDVQK